MQSIGRRLLGTVLTSTVLAACGGGGGGSLPPAPSVHAPVAAGSTSNVALVADMTGIARSIAANQRPDGAILYTATQVEPYYANIAAIGAVHAGVDSANVQQWMQWYVLRSKDPNPWSIPGAITDYNVTSNGTLVSAGEADSVDSYAATFISLAATAWREGNAPLRAYVADLGPDIDRIASAIDAVSDVDGLTWALPTYQLKYVMDNSEVYRGLVDLATLRTQAFGDVAGGLSAAAHALQIQTAIQTEYWDPNRGAFALALDANGNKLWPQAGNWYDQTTQLWPILHGVVAPSSQPAQTAYAGFTNAFPGWPLLQKPDPFPWASVALVALQMNDQQRASAYVASVQAQYSPQFAYPWYCAESGWYVRVLLGLDAPQTVAVL
jgi:hypothetical protein